jgi:hypothetical protein
MGNIDFQNGLMIGLSKIGQEKNSIKVIDKPCHIADLEVGTYLVKGNPFLNGESRGKVTFINVEDVKEGDPDDFVVNDDYMCLYDGLLSITYKHVDTDDIRESAFITFCSVGFHELQDTDTTHSNAFTVYGMITHCFKPIKDTPEIVEPIKLNHWYSMTETVLGTYAIHSDIPALGVYDYVDSIKKEILGEVNELSSLVGGAD